jgi:phosphohistidine phosphatase SixA
MLGIVAQLGAAAPVAPASELRGERLMEALQLGGYTLLVRHARTDRSIPTRETPGYSPLLRADQRNLTADGERDVRLMADVVRRYALPIGEVLSSPIYRCRETADAFGVPTTTLALRIFPLTKETATLVAAAPARGMNRVLVTHHFVIEELVPGIAPGDIGESEVAVVRPTAAGGVELVGRITLADWAQLAGTESAATESALPAHAPAAVQGHGPGQTPGSAVDPAVFHRSRAGALTAGYIHAFNTGDAERMRAFIEASLERSAQRSTAERVSAFERLFEQHGPLAPHAVTSLRGDTAVVQVRSKTGLVALEVIAAPAPSERARSITFRSQGSAGHR